MQKKGSQIVCVISFLLSLPQTQERSMVKQHHKTIPSVSPFYLTTRKMIINYLISETDPA